MKYEEHIQEIAMEICSHVLLRDWNITTGPEREICDKAARIAVRLQCEAVSKLLSISGNVLFSAKGNRGIYLVDNGLISSLTCNSCNKELVIDRTGIYCNNSDCEEFWKNKNKVENPELLKPKMEDNE